MIEVLGWILVFCFMVWIEYKRQAPRAEVETVKTDACQNCGNPKPLEDVGLCEDFQYFVCMDCKPLFAQCKAKSTKEQA